MRVQVAGVQHHSDTNDRPFRYSVKTLQIQWKSILAGGCFISSYPRRHCILSETSSTTSWWPRAAWAVSGMGDSHLVLRAPHSDAMLADSFVRGYARRRIVARPSCTWSRPAGYDRRLRPRHAPLPVMLDTRGGTRHGARHERLDRRPRQ